MPPIELEGQRRPETFAAGKGEFQVSRSQHGLVASAGLRQGEGQRLGPGFGPLAAQSLQFLVHPLRAFQLALCLPGLAGLVPEAFDECGLVLDFLVNGLGLALPLQFHFLPPLQKLGERTGPQDGLGVPQVQGLGGHFVQKNPVVGHEHQDPGKAQQIFLQPGYGFQIQMVSGFVQQKHVCPRGEHPSQFGPLPPSAAKRPDGPVQVGLGKAQSAQDSLGPVLRAVAQLVLQQGLLLG